MEKLLNSSARTASGIFSGSGDLFFLLSNESINLNNDFGSSAVPFPSIRVSYVQIRSFYFMGREYLKTIFEWYTNLNK